VIARSNPPAIPKHIQGYSGDWWRWKASITQNIVSLLLAVALLSGCEKDEAPLPLVNVPTWFPALPVPADNALTSERIALGRRLFYEPLLSVDSSKSCASCHIQVLGFADANPISVGVHHRVGLRNVPTLTNIAYVPNLFAEGGVNSLELQAQAPIFNPDEMGFTIAGFLERIATDATYTAMFEAAYGRAPDAYGISRALAAFERTLISGNSRYDQFEYQGDANALSEAEKRGLDLFFSAETNCSQCHTPPLFTTLEYANIGLYTTYADSGRARLTTLPEDRGKFRIPTLRNVALTAPYMHNGSKSTLAEVVAHFNSGGVAHPNKSNLIQPLNLSAEEQADLVAFLGALTDEGFVANTEFGQP
jgi:cytochrome c peroxidase